MRTYKINIKRYLLLPIFSIAIFCSFGIQSAYALPVFPGAEGFGTNTVAGRGGTVYRVTNLNDSGSGSLRDCVNKSGPRVCIFEISGTIAINNDLSINNPYITIAGQTAPSPGITIRNFPIRPKTHDVLIQHIRVRTGDTGGGDRKNRDAFGVEGNNPYNIVMDHVSASWAGSHESEDCFIKLKKPSEKH